MVTVELFLTHTLTFSQVTEVRYFVPTDGTLGVLGDAYCDGNSPAHEHTITGGCYLRWSTLYVTRGQAEEAAERTRTDHAAFPFLGDVTVTVLDGTPAEATTAPLSDVAIAFLRGCTADDLMTQLAGKSAAEAEAMMGVCTPKQLHALADLAGLSIAEGVRKATVIRTILSDWY